MPLPSRRHFLRFAGAATAAGLLPRASWATASGQLSLGVMSSAYAGFPVEEAARKIAADGFSCVVCDFAFADVKFDPTAPDWAAATRAADALKAHGLRTSSLFGYYNIVDPDLARRKQGEQAMIGLLEHARDLGTSVVSTGTGSLDPASMWNIHPDNTSDSAYAECRDSLARLARIAEKQGACVAIEPYWKSVIFSVDRAAQLFHEVDSPGLKLVMDPCNYYRKADFPRMRPIMDDLFAKLSSQIVVTHAKDTAPSPDRDDTDLPYSGKGQLDYPYYIDHLKQLDKPFDLIVEHVQYADVAPARDFVKRFL